MKPGVIILTGEKQSGKTSFLKQWCEHRSDVAGVLTPIIEEKRVFFTIATKEIFPMEAMGHEDSYSVGRFKFSVKGFNKADEFLRSRHANTRYLVMDEIGPLELLSKKGFYQTLIYLLQNPIDFTLVLVCRAGLALDLKDLCLQYGQTASIQTISINSLPHSF